MSQPPERGPNIQAAFDYAKHAWEFSERGDYKHAVYHLMIAVNRLGMELENVNEILIMKKILSGEGK